MRNIHREKRGFNFTEICLARGSSTGLKRRLWLGGRAPTFIHGSPSAQLVLVGVRTKRADQAALHIITSLLEHLV
jgi:hypothetical protein